MENLVRRHAILNVWSATNQDFQHNINLVRITPNGGVLSNFPLLWDTLLSPRPIENKRHYYHFYQVGQVPSEILDVLKQEDRWVSLADFNKQNDILIDVYSASGQIIPKDHVFVSFIYNKNLVVAVRVNFKMDYGTRTRTLPNRSTITEKFTLDNQKLIIRFYSNAWFNNDEFIKTSEHVQQPIVFEYKTMTGEKDWNDLQALYKKYLKADKSNQHKFVWFKDGFKINAPTARPKDYLGGHYGFVFDDSFFHVDKFELKHLPAFRSEIDYTRRKYLILSTVNDFLIHYWDDIDFYITNTRTGKGCYFNRSAKNAIRQLTHNCYSLDADTLEDYVRTHDFLGKYEDCSVEMYMRQGGRKNGLFNQKNRLEELYLLPREQIIEAFINTPSLVPEWRAASLEKSKYMELISANSDKISNELIAEVYGYNGLSTVFNNPLNKVKDGKLPITPVMHIKDLKTGTGVRNYWFYNTSGQFVNYFTEDTLIHDIPLTTTTDATDVGYVESFNMKLSKTGLDLYGNMNLESTDLEQYGFRCFVTQEVNGVPTSDWDDVTESKLYTYHPSSRNNKPRLEWNWALLSQANLVPLIYVMKSMFVWKTKITRASYNGTIHLVPKFHFRWNNTYHTRNMDIPVGQIDVIVNGITLIEDIDYVVDCPNIIINTHGIHSVEDLDITVRYYGFANPENNKNWKPREVGFVKGGKLSIDCIYGINEDKNNRVILSGLLHSIHEFNTGEKNGNRIAPIDGQPYALLDYVVPIENIFKGANSYRYYKETLDIDKRVSDYLTPRIKQIEPEYQHIQKNRYKLVSPFLSRIIRILTSGIDLLRDLPVNYTQIDVAKIVEPYTYLLKYDPCCLDYDSRYILIEPHGYPTAVSVNARTYAFLETLVKLYLKDKVDLTPSVIVGD